MMVVGELQTSRTWSESLADLKDEFRKWGIDDYIVPTMKESRAAQEVKVSFAVNGRWSYPTCGRWPGSPQKNLRAIVLAIEAVRKADQRGIGSLLAEAAKHLALGSGKRDPYQVLGVRPGMSREAFAFAYRQKIKETHPDTGGSTDAFLEVRAAAEELGLI